MSLKRPHSELIPTWLARKFTEECMPAPLPSITYSAALATLDMASNITAPSTNFFMKSSCWGVPHLNLFIWVSQSTVLPRVLIKYNQTMTALFTTATDTHRFCVAPMMDVTDRHCRYF